MRTAEYLERTTFFLACNNIDKCSVIDFSNSSTPEREILVGNGYSKISVVKRAKFFLATYPSSNSVALYHLPETACMKLLTKDCDSIDIEIPLECYLNSHIHPTKAECVCNKQHYFDEAQLICLPCHSSCSFICKGPLAEDCIKHWYYDKIEVGKENEKIMRYDFKCYDDPVEWYDRRTGECKCFEGYLDENGHCTKCPTSMFGCLSCDGIDFNTCLNCQSGFVLVDGKCFDCGDPDPSKKNDDCPLSFSFYSLVPIFNIDVRFVMLRIKQDFLNYPNLAKYQIQNLEFPEEQNVVYTYDYMMADMDWPYSQLIDPGKFLQERRIDDNKGFPSSQSPVWDIANSLEFLATTELGEDIPLKWKKMESYSTLRAMNNPES